MAGISGIQSNLSLYGGLFDSQSIAGPYSGYNFKINTSTEKFKGNVTGYKPVDKSENALASDQARNYLAAVKDLGNKLKDATAKATQAGQSVFKALSGLSSNNDALSVSVSNQADASKFSQQGNDKKVSIQQLAQSQRNTGSSLSAASLNGAAAGTNQFAIEKDGKSFDFSVNINVSDSARTAQEKVANAINSKNIGVKATVEYDEKTKKSSLVLSSAETGEKNAFTVSDKGGGNIIETLGAGQAAQKAQDAKYTVDGEAKTSDKNTVDLGDGLTGALKKAGSEEINVSTKKDVDGISNAVRDMVNQFNSLLKTAKDYSGDRGANDLRQRLDTIGSSYASSLKNIGITRSKDGYLEVDSKKLTDAFENGSAERFLGNDSYGFTQRLSQLAKQADSDPNRFLSRESRSGMAAAQSGSTAPAWNENFERDYLRYMSSQRNQELSNIGLLFSMGI